MGEFGELIASRFLEQQGLDILASNVAVGSGELDLLARDGTENVAIEVRTVTSTRDDALDAIDAAKRRRVRELAARARVGRVDFVGIRLHPSYVDVHWLPGSS